jgi:septal ring factor EnvC (AmiA/AmiB activator)
MGDITNGNIVTSMGEKRRVRNQVKRVMSQRDETIKVLELNADIAQSRIEELEDVQISLEQENARLRAQLAAARERANS